MFRFDPPENIRKPLDQKGTLKRNGLTHVMSTFSLRVFFNEGLNFGSH